MRTTARDEPENGLDAASPPAAEELGSGKPAASSLALGGNSPLQQRVTFQSLPWEIVLLILTFLPAEHGNRMAATNKEYRVRWLGWVCCRHGWV